ncbi:hypothetical protein FF011L_25910 [Roseimaritima multifibrata]|uniref:Uncharacterized protein n=1 Tax=Roseimaritima multifibrata TaxID=1930274 RepID=A0A517MG10_9BACT|nr:hypothetical protein FF011L_25910 [Roseimaritima multifibrata]
MNPLHSCETALIAEILGFIESHIRGGGRSPMPSAFLAERRDPSGNRIENSMNLPGRLHRSAKQTTRRCQGR